MPGFQDLDEDALVAAAQAGDARARARLIEVFMPRLEAVARAYRATPLIEQRELLQEGAVGLLRALQSYDPSRRVPFWGYASWWVRQAMQHLVAELVRPTVLSDHALRQLSRLKDAHRAALQEHGAEPSVEALAERSGLTRDQVDALVAVDRPAQSLQEPVAREASLVGTFGDLLEDPLAEGEYERVLDAMEAQELSALLSELTGREREVLRARSGVDGPEQTLSEVGERLGVSAERVRQIESRARGKLETARG